MELDLCEHFQADSQKTLFVTGIERRCIGDDITHFSEVNGTISKVARVPDEPRQSEGRTLIVYESEQAILKIDPSALGEVISSESMGGSGFLSIFQGELQASPTPHTETWSLVEHNINTTADNIPNID